MKGFHNVIIFYLVLLFTYSSITKLLDASLVPIITNEPLLFDTDLADIMAKIIPGIELLIALLLGLQKTKTIGLLGATFILISYSIYVSWNLNHGYEMPCSCTGPISYLSWTQYLYFNIINLTLIFSGLYLLKRN